MNQILPCSPSKMSRFTSADHFDEPIHSVVVEDQMLYQVIDQECNTKPIQEGPYTRYLGEHYGWSLRQLDEMVKWTIAFKDNPLNRTEIVKAFVKRYVPLLNHFLTLSRLDGRLSEHAQLFFSVVLKHSGYTELAGPPPERLINRNLLQLPYLVEPFTSANYGIGRLDALLHAIRDGGKTPQFAKKVSLRRDKAKSNLTTARTLVANAFYTCPHVSVLRMDLGFKEAEQQTIPEAKTCLARLLNNSRQKPTLFEGGLGQVWKFEFGIWGEGGFHFHVIFLFDPVLALDYSTLVKSIGGYWETNITKGRGKYLDSSSDFRLYKRYGAQVISREDLEGRKQLDIGLQCLISKDALYRPEIGAGRIFGSGRP